jgi:hypothetical protein
MSHFLSRAALRMPLESGVIQLIEPPAAFGRLRRIRF